MNHCRITTLAPSETMLPDRGFFANLATFFYSIATSLEDPATFCYFQPYIKVLEQVSEKSQKNSDFSLQRKHGVAVCFTTPNRHERNAVISPHLRYHHESEPI
ncbi:hypothetical protein TNCV_1793391 [Trichonephila clavipes]|nr:hypothetical protein TNCV_1793391 [Trichonephila clavipes]